MNANLTTEVRHLLNLVAKGHRKAINPLEIQGIKNKNVIFFKKSRYNGRTYYNIVLEFAPQKRTIQVMNLDKNAQGFFRINFPYTVFVLNICTQSDSYSKPQFQLMVDECYFGLSFHPLRRSTERIFRFPVYHYHGLRHSSVPHFCLGDYPYQYVYDNSIDTVIDNFLNYFWQSRFLGKMSKMRKLQLRNKTPSSMKRFVWSAVKLKQFVKGHNARPQVEEFCKGGSSDAWSGV